ncbi:hypothetical protein SAMN05878276_2441 [Aquipseudomonas alcaligenes]|nr:hypothetical protein SAMN05878276_2441 [Pseudomonas alcaligenes]
MRCGAQSYASALRASMRAIDQRACWSSQPATVHGPSDTKGPGPVSQSPDSQPGSAVACGKRHYTENPHARSIYRTSTIDTPAPDLKPVIPTRAGLP